MLRTKGHRSTVALNDLWLVVLALILLMLLLVDGSDILCGLIVAQTRIRLIIFLPVCDWLLIFPRVWLFLILLLLLIALLECLVLFLRILGNRLHERILIRVGMLKLCRLKSFILRGVGILTTTVWERIRDVGSIVLFIGVGGRWLIYDSLTHETWLWLLCETACVEFFLFWVLIGEAIGLEHLMTHWRVLCILLRMCVLMVVTLLNQ
jgi:hypothetical protein